MSYRDIWTDDHGEDGLREKFHVYKATDYWIGDGDDVSYDPDAMLGATGEFVFVLRPESDYEAWAMLHEYADRVEDRSPKLAVDIRTQLRRIQLHQDQNHD